MQVVNAQPRYRVVVDPPVVVTDIPAGVSFVQSRLCFREVDSTSDDMHYCPLGFQTFPNDNFDGASIQLIPQGGSDSIPPAYPSGIGLLVTITGVRADGHLDTLGTYRSGRVGGAPGELVTIGPARAPGDGGEFVTFTATLGVSCVAGFTGPQCSPPGSTTGTVATPPPTTQQPATTEAATEGPTTPEPEIVTTGGPKQSPITTVTTATDSTTAEPVLVTTKRVSTGEVSPDTFTTAEPAVVTTENSTTAKPTSTEEPATTISPSPDDPTTGTPDLPITQASTSASPEKRTTATVAASDETSTVFMTGKSHFECDSIPYKFTLLILSIRGA